MQEIEYIDGIKIISNYPDATPEEIEQAKREVIQKMFILFSKRNKDIDIKVK